MFIVGGFNAYPAEIENLLLRHPAVAQAAVVAIPHPELGEVGCAFVVPEAGADLGPEELVQWSRQNMSNYKVPRHVAIVLELPVSANGKVDKATLHRNAAQQTATAG
jgi:acyl-CoA synthetase (AMP-forming)/AMP-acid ligase II